MKNINHLVVWILAIVYFLLNWVWYAPFAFGNVWLNLHAKTATDIENTHSAGAYVIAFVAAVVINYVLAILISKVNPETPFCGLKLGLLCWFAFVFMEYASISVFSAFETNPWPLICIDMGRPLIGFAISSYVLARYRKLSA